MSKQSLSVSNDEGVLLCGYYKKFKTMKKKFFVLYADTPCKVARIEYYDNERKYRSGFPPKRVIKIKRCFNINRRLYTKHDFVIVLASKEGGFGIVMDSEEDMNTWLNHLIYLQRSGETCFDFPTFDYVWQVIIQKKGIAEQHNIFGSHHICLTNKSVTFIKIGREKHITEKIIKVDILLTTIRRCGDSQCFFYMEIGRQSSLGPGELWMETEDSLIAQDMHKMILSKMVSLNEALIEPMRKRSSSATETTNLHHVRKSSQNLDVASNYSLGAQSFCRDRCDSLPSRNRSSSESSNRIQRISSNSASTRAVNFHVSNTSSMGYSASEESVSVEDCEESTGIQHLISSRSPEDVILEEYINDVSQLEITEKSDTSSVANSSLCTVHKASSPIVNHCNATNLTDENKYVCGYSNDQLHFTTQSYSFGKKYDNNITKEFTGDRVRAFSVGSRNKGTRTCTKTTSKLFNSNSVDYSTRKSISVPVLINTSSQYTDRMDNLMEIDFSKSIEKTFKNNLFRNKNMSSSEESAQRNKKENNGYLEMKPVSLDNNIVKCNERNINIVNIQSQNNYSIEQKTNKTDPTISGDSINDETHISNYLSLNSKDLHLSDKDFKINPTSTTVIYSVCREKQSDGTNLRQLEEVDINKDLYYASLDLPNCSNEVNNRYGFQDGLNEQNPGELKNEYAKINFVQTNSSGSLSQK